MRMHIGHVAMRVTDLDRSARHAASTLGLHETHNSPGTVMLSANAKHHELQLIAGDRPGLDHIGLEVESADDLGDPRDRLVATGAEIVSERIEEPGLEQSLRFVGPSDVTFEIYTGMPREPLAPDNVLRPLVRKLGHITVLSDDKPELEAFTLGVMGFRVSDRLGELTWMRCDPDHHGLAVGPAPVTRLHHYAFESPSWSHLGAYADHVARDRQQFVWGPGRHGIGFNIFTYLPDPEGAIVEVYTDMQRIDDEAAYRAADWPDPARALNLWGPPPPDGFLEMGVPVLDPRTASGARLPTRGAIRGTN